MKKSKLLLLTAIICGFAIPVGSQGQNSEVIKTTLRDKWHVKNGVQVSFGNPSYMRQAVLSLPIPTDNGYQHVSNVKLSGNGSAHYDDPIAHVDFVKDSDFENFEEYEEFDVDIYNVEVDFSKIDQIYEYDTTTKDYSKYTESDGKYIDLNNPTIIEVGEELWSQSGDYLEYARACSKYVSTNLQYNLHGKGLLSVAEMLALGGGECGDFTTLFVNLCRYKGIPARHVVAIYTNYAFHVWPEFYLENYGWIPVDPTFDNSQGALSNFGKRATDTVVMSYGLNNTINVDSVGSFNSEFFQTLFCWYWWTNETPINFNHYIQGEKLADSLHAIVSEPEDGQSEAFYSINGMRLENRPTTPGVYIMAKDGQRRKILIR